MTDTSKAIREIITNPFAGRGLSKRQALIAGMQARGLSIEQISGELNVTPNTVKTHIKHARKKIGPRTNEPLSAILIRQISAVLDAKGA